MSAFLYEFPISIMPTVGPDCLTYEQYSVQSQDFALAMMQEIAEIDNICNELSLAPHWILDTNEEEDHNAQENAEIVNLCNELSLAPHWILNTEEPATK